MILIAYDEGFSHLVLFISMKRKAILSVSFSNMLIVKNNINNSSKISFLSFSAYMDKASKTHKKKKEVEEEEETIHICLRQTDNNFRPCYSC